jgi:hypothetical protein
MGQEDEPTDEEHEQNFNDHDVDGSGRITKAEMGAYLAKLCGL